MGRWSDEGSSILVSTLQNNSGFEENMKNRIKSGWIKRREVSGILSDKMIPLSLKVYCYSKTDSRV